ncbi:hypothetical protein HZC34_04565 [Candidatus Saganbacteria bacterium]|nr:hypothetical protein [Candidatus Saganbacteria bacterium]
MLSFEINISRIKIPGHGRLASVPNAREAARFLGQFRSQTRIDLSSTAENPSFPFQRLADKLRDVGVAGLAVNPIEYSDKSKSEEWIVSILKTIVRRPHEVAANLDEFHISPLFSYVVDPGDLPAVHQAIRQRRLGFLEIDDVWKLASPFLLPTELVKIATICKGRGIGKAIGHPLFPSEVAPRLIVDYIVRRMRTPDLWFTADKIEHHIEQIGDGDFFRCETSSILALSVLLRGGWYYLYFTEEGSPEVRWCDVIRNIRGGLLAKPIVAREQILTLLEVEKPQLTWLLRRTMEDDFEKEITS